jgi:hypothetical protein
MALPPTILDRVETFRRNLESYLSSDYKEAQLRREFLDPLFEALGWDMRNRAGYAEAYKDVVHEDTLRIGDLGTKAPDYSFRIGGTRKFFVEVKKPSVSIKDDPEPAQQLRRYSWSAKLPLGVLTDFQEFAIYDTRLKPLKDDPPHKGRVFYCRFEEYPQKWDEIAAIFSRDSVLKGSFDRYAVSMCGKRGTASVDDDFLGTLNEWRLRLAKNLALRNGNLSQRELNFAVQRILDRIIFLRIAEDRGIENYGQLLALTGSVQVEESPDEETEDVSVPSADLTLAEPATVYRQGRVTVYPRLCEIFERADFRYNSGLFHFHPDKDRDEAPDLLTLRLQIDDLVLRDIIVGLYYPESPYVFSVLSSEILGHVYEQFLGKVIRLTEGHRAVVEDKPEVRKAGGVYYTPTYIVDYIVRQTVGPLVEGRTPKQVEKLCILDPACGSGSFLLGAFQFLLDWHLRHYVDNDPQRWARQKNPPIYETAPNAFGVGRGSGNWQLTVSERKRILTNNLYGVDIDAEAVEVTKLSLLLKVLEGEARERRGKQTEFHRVLPALGKNIKCGNSLIGSDFYRQLALPDLDDEARYRINAFDWEPEFADIMKAGGFDAVIGNPPYGAYLHDEDKAYLRAHYPHQTYQLDSYLLFLERSVRDVLRHDGYYGVIIPNPWLTNLLQTAMRRFVVNHTKMLEIVHFRFPVFPQVVVDTQIVLLQKANPSRHEVRVTVAESKDAFVNQSFGEGLLERRHRQRKWRNLDGEVINIFTSEEDEALANKISASGVKLGLLCDINVGIKPYQVGKGTPPQIRSVVKERPFDSDRAATSEHRQYLRGTDIGRYRIAPRETRFIRYGPWLAEPRPAADFDSPEKILMRQTGDSLVAAMDQRRRLCLNNLHVVVRRDDAPAVRYLLGIINSTLLNWYYHILNPEVGEALAEVKRTNVARLPIRICRLANRSDRVRHDELIALVERILKLHEQFAAARTPEAQERLQREIAQTDRAIDQLVYQLYDLTRDEIAIVEQAIA